MLNATAAASRRSVGCLSVKLSENSWIDGNAFQGAGSRGPKDHVLDGSRIAQWDEADMYQTDNRRVLSLRPPVACSRASRYAAAMRAVATVSTVTYYDDCVWNKIHSVRCFKSRLVELLCWRTLEDGQDCAVPSLPALGPWALTVDLCEG